MRGSIMYHAPTPEDLMDFSICLSCVFVGALRISRSLGFRRHMVSELSKRSHECVVALVYCISSLAPLKLLYEA